MPIARVTGTPRRALGVALGLLFVLPAFGGCISAFDDDVVPGVKTACPAPGTPPPQVPEVMHAYAKQRTATDERVPPQTDAIHLALLLPPGPVTDLERGVDLAVKELKAVGAEIALDKRRVDGTDGVTVRAAFNASLNGERPGVVLSGLDDAATSELVWLARERQMPLVAVDAASTRIRSTQDAGGFLFRIPWADAVEGRALAELLWSSGCRSANVIVESDARSVDVANAFREAFTRKGGEVARVVTLQADAANADAAVDRVEFLRTGDRDTAPRPEAVVVVADASNAAKVLRAGYDSRLSARSAFFLSEAALDETFVTEAGTDANGHLLAVGLRGTSAMAAVTRATDAFERAYRTETQLVPTNASARGYDAVYTAVLAAACGRDDDSRTLLARMPQVNDRDAGDTEVSGADPLFAITTATARCAVNYVGASGDYDWDRLQEPVTGRYYFWAVSGDGSIKVTHSRVEPPALNG